MFTELCPSCTVMLLTENKKAPHHQARGFINRSYYLHSTSAFRAHGFGTPFSTLLVAAISAAYLGCFCCFNWCNMAIGKY
jgi:hypothetical protein